MAAVCSWLFFCSAMAAQTTPGSPSASPEEILSSYLRETPEAVGITVAFEALGGGSRWQGAVGVIAKGSAERLTPQHGVRIASNTKPYTAASILRLQEQGRLSITDPIRHHLSGAIVDMLEAGDYDTRAIEIRHLLTHTSGLREHVTDDYIQEIQGNPQRTWSAEEQIKMAVAAGPPLGPPGERFSYCDTGYVLLGRMIEYLTRKPLGVAYRELLGFDLIGLSETWMEGLEAPAHVERPHQYWGDFDTFSWNPSFDLYGGGGLIATPRDMARFLAALLQGRVLESEASLEIMCSLEISSDQDPFRGGLYFLDIDRDRGWGHTGFWNTFAFYFPAREAVIAGAFLQRDGPGARDLLGRLLAALGSPPGEASASPCRSRPGE